MSDELSRFMAAIRSVESGGNYRILGPMTQYGRATGAYQFLDSTWGGYKGYRSAYLAPPAVQDEKARQMMSHYYNEFHRWDLVAVAWQGGEGSARRARHDPEYTRRIGDGNLHTNQYVNRVMSRMGSVSSSPSKKKKQRPANDDLHPWKLPPNLAGQAGKIIIDPALLLQISRKLTEHLAIAESVYHQCTDAAQDLGKVRLADTGAATRLHHALDEALEDAAGVRRLPAAFSRDIGYVVAARDRAMQADDSVLSHERRTVDALVRQVNRSHNSKVVKSHVAGRLHDLFAPDHAAAKHHRTGLAAVNVGKAWGGSKSVFDQFVTPFMKHRGLAAGSQKRPYDTVGGPAMSDHYTGSTEAYATDYPTFSGADDASALAKAMGIKGWQPNSYQSANVRIDGHTFRVQILWGAAIEHGDHVHVGLKLV
jgi:hypothetical protein